MAERRKKPNRADRKKERAWIDKKLAELKTETAKLPEERQEQLKRELDEEKGE